MNGNAQQIEQIQQMMENTGPIIVLLIAGVVFLVVYGILILLCLLLSNCLSAVPEEHRQQSPGLIWLLLIPCFPIVWNFFVYPKIADSFQSYFIEKNRPEVGDCGKTLSMVFCILVVVNIVISWIPIIGMLSCLIWPVNLVLLILILVKFYSLKSMVEMG